jgi:hypothetical protein
MKTLSRTFTFAVLAVVAIIAVLSLRAFAVGSNQEIPAHKKFKIIKPITCGHPGPGGYCQLTTSQQALDTALIALEAGHNGDHGKHHLKFLCKDGDNPVEPYNPHGQDAAHGHPKCQAKTVKVTKSEAANTAAADASAANDPNAVHYLYSDYSADIKAVLDCFQ